MAGYSARQSSFTTGDTILAAHSNDEFNQVLAAFHATTGHSHDGTAGEGGPISTLRDADSNNKILVDTSNNHLEFYVEVSSSAVEQIKIQDGAIVPVTDNDIDLGTSSLEFKDLYVDGTAHVDAINFNGTAIASTAAELNILDGDTSATSTTVADADRVVLNDGGSMVQVAVTDLAAYFDDEITAMPNLTSVGTLTTLTVDDITINGSTVSDSGDFTIDGGADIILDADGGDIFFKDGGTTFGSATNTSGNLIIKSGTTTALTFSGADVTIAGDLTVSGDDITMGTNTDTAIMVADGTNFNPVVPSGDVTLTNAGVFGIASGVIVNADINASAAIADSKLATISTADKVSGAAVQIDGATDGTSITIADSDKFLIDDGGTTKYVNASQINAYTSAAVALDDISTGDAASTLATSAGNITIDAQGTDTDIIFKGTDGGVDTTFLTIDGSEAGAATFNNKIVATELDISGDIDVDGTTNLDVVDIDGAVDMASTLGVTGVVTANAGVVIDNITIDGTEIDLSSGDLTVDVAGDITLDAGGSDIRFDAGGSEYGKLNLSGNNLNIHSSINDADIVFKGEDAGSTITALTLDMSDAGTATFNNGVRLGDNNKLTFGDDNDFEIYFDPTNGSIIREAGAANLVLAGNDVQITNGAMNETHADFNNNGSVDLYHNNVKKFETTTNGVTVTGTVTATAFSGDGSSLTNLNAASVGKAIAMAIVFG